MTSAADAAPEGGGDEVKEVTVRLENEDGDLLLGQQINTRVRSGTKKRLRRSGVVVSATLGVLGVIASVILQVNRLLSL